jgi:hypothetical protein
MNKSHTFEDFELFTHVSNAFLCIVPDTTGIEIKQDFPAIVVEGDRDNLIKFFIEVLEWDRDIDVIRSLDSFEITSDFEQGYISFFMKPDNHA